MVPMTPGFTSDFPDLRRVGIDEADDLHAQFLAPLVQFAWRGPTAAAPVPTSSSRSRGRARCASHSNARRQPTMIDDDERRRDEEDAAADDQVRGRRSRARPG